MTTDVPVLAFTPAYVEQIDANFAAIAAVLNASSPNNTLRGNVSGGAANATDVTAAQVNGMLGVGSILFKASVNFNVANTDTVIPITLPAGYTRYLVAQVRISGASASLTTATCGVFTGAGGTGVAVVSAASAITVSSASENTANNAQSLTIASGVTQTITAANLYFRVGTAQGSAATGTVTIAITPVS
jgi:hypothetical protein